MLLLLNVLESVNHEVIICSSRGLCWNPSPESGVLNPTHLSFLLKKKKNLIYLLYTGCDFSCIFHVVLVKSLFIFFRVTKVKRINERVFG